MAPASHTTPHAASHELYASCPEGFEDALADELRALDLRQVRRLKGRVTFVGGVADAYRACLWSRLSSRIFVTIARFDCLTADDLYQGAYDIAWEDILRPGATIALTARGTSDELRNSHYSALRVKDAICDRLLKVAGYRPDVDVENPNARITLSLRTGRASLQLDLSGDPLFKRLPREATRPGAAHVLRPDYAALALAQLGWQQACANIAATATCPSGTPAVPAAAIGNTPAVAAGSIPTAEPDDPINTADNAERAHTAGKRPALPILIDACCAGGGIVLEAAQILTDRAPNIDREHWGFQAWAEHDEATWQALRAEAIAQAKAGRTRAGRIVATDVAGDAVSFARRLLKTAGLADCVTFAQPDAHKILRKLPVPTSEHTPVSGGVVLDTTEISLTKLPRLLALATTLRTEMRGPCEDAASSPALVALTRDAALEQALGAPSSSLTVMPNNEEARLLTFAGDANGGIGSPNRDAVCIDLGSGAPCPVLLPESEQFARRLRKVGKLRRKWAQREGVSCYRVYDADLPDYSAAIDLYEGSASTPGRWLVIAEYAAPRHIDPALAETRLLDILAIAPRILAVDPENVYAKARMRSRGGSQYGRKAGTAPVNSPHGRLDAKAPIACGSAARPSQGTAKSMGPATPPDIRTRHLPLIEEGGLTFAVNFDDYLDTGIFLDHRITRGLVRERARGKRFFLNLFAYTGTATCYAASAGVEETVTVDLSNTYLDWAERNMEQNGFTGRDHHYVRADVMSWIRDMRETRNRWDLIFCDPPTFSNSSKMGRRTWDVQRDHIELLIGLSRLLSREGEAIFSCNLRTFCPDTMELARAGVVLTDITAQTIPEDFSRNQRIHHCYLVRRYTSEEAMRMVGMDESAVRARTKELRERARGRKRQSPCHSHSRALSARRG